MNQIVNHSRYVYSKFHDIYDELDSIYFLIEEPLRENDLKERKNITVELKEYVDDFNDYTEISNYDLYLCRKSFDPEGKKLKEIFKFYRKEYE